MIRGMDVIYADELLAVNALTDYLLLLLAARAADLPLKRGRFALAGLLGGIYALAAALLPGPLRTVWAKLGASGLVCAAAFGTGKAARRGWAAFLGVSALFAGALFAAALLSGQGWGPGSVTARVSGRLFLLCFGLCRAAVRVFRSRAVGASETVTVVLTLGGRSATLTALADTGNRLTDPVSGAAVLVADSASLRPLLGDALPSSPPADAAALLRLLSRDPALAPRLGLVPYAAVGGSGLLLTVRPDSVAADGVGVRALVAVSPTPVGNGEYNAIF